jgi:hypothetical protein
MPARAEVLLHLARHWNEKCALKMKNTETVLLTI